MNKPNRFQTLNGALDSEGLVDTWELHYQPIGYGQTFSYTFDDGSKYGHYVSITRFEDGTYERPVHYKR
jgi:hypothetical protein